MSPTDRLELSDTLADEAAGRSEDSGSRQALEALAAYLVDVDDRALMDAPVGHREVGVLASKRRADPRFGDWYQAVAVLAATMADDEKTAVRDAEDVTNPVTLLDVETPPKAPESP